MTARGPHAILKVGLTTACAIGCAVFGRLASPISPLVDVAVIGGGVVAASFLLSWAAEAAQADVSASLATGILALITVLPEYAVDAWFAYSAGHAPTQAEYAAANLTGSNRLLIGLGWPLVFLVVAAGARHRGAAHDGVLRLDRRRRVDVGFLGVAGAYSFLIVRAARIALHDAVVLLAAFALYAWSLSRQERSEPELTGVSAAVARLSRWRRRATVGMMFAVAALVVVSLAHPFADALLAAGTALHVSRFLLVQWIAPLASESPELLVAGLLAWRGNADAAMGALLSSKVNQWTLLVGSLPIAYRIGGGTDALPLDGRQTEEFLLTASQTLFGFALLSGLALRRWHAIVLFLGFAAQFALRMPGQRILFSAAYLGCAAIAFLLEQRNKSTPGR